MSIACSPKRPDRRLGTRFPSPLWALWGEGAGPSCCGRCASTSPDLDLLPQEGCQVDVEQIADSGKLDVGGQILDQSLWIECIVALLGKNRGYPLAPVLLHRVEDAQLVVDEHVVIGGIEALDVLQLAFLMNVDEHAIIDRSP